MIDVEKLRNDLLNYYYGLAYAVSPIAFMEVTKVQEASEDELIEIAKKEKFDMEKYKVKTRNI